jgi:3-hydroxypropanoate dehydrogenase
MIVQSPMGRIEQEDEIACAVVFLASDESSYITGIDCSLMAACLKSEPCPIPRRFNMFQLSDESLNLIFREARTYNAWLDKPVDDSLLAAVYDLAKMGPTSANMCPMRLVFVKSKEAKEKLKPALDAGNVDKTMAAPVTAIIGMDIHFYEQLPKLFPHADARAWFKDLPDNILEYIALRNSSLQGAYFMLAARSLGLDCGPMSGFDNAKVDAAFFAGTTIKSNFLCNLGYGNKSKLYPRSPRLNFKEACQII